MVNEEQCYAALCVFRSDEDPEYRTVIASTRQSAIEEFQKLGALEVRGPWEVSPEPKEALMLREYLDTMRIGLIACIAQFQSRDKWRRETGKSPLPQSFVELTLAMSTMQRDIDRMLREQLPPRAVEQPRI